MKKLKKIFMLILLVSLFFVYTLNVNAEDESNTNQEPSTNENTPVEEPKEPVEKYVSYYISATRGSNTYTSLATVEQSTTLSEFDGQLKLSKDSVKLIDADIDSIVIDDSKKGYNKTLPVVITGNNKVNLKLVDIKISISGLGYLKTQLLDSNNNVITNEETLKEIVKNNITTKLKVEVKDGYVTIGEEIKEEEEEETSDKVYDLSKDAVEVSSTEGFDSKHSLKATDLTNSRKKSKIFKEYNVLAVYDIYILDQTGNTADYSNGEFTIRIKLDEEPVGEVLVLYINDNNIEETIEPEVNGKYVTFETSHLSEYAIVTYKDEVKGTIVNKNKKESHLLLYVLIALSVILVTAFIVLLVIKFKRDKKEEEQEEVIEQPSIEENIVEETIETVEETIEEELEDTGIIEEIASPGEVESTKNEEESE